MDEARKRECPQVTTATWTQEWGIHIPNAEKVIWRKPNRLEGFCKKTRQADGGADPRNLDPAPLLYQLGSINGKYQAN